jgi:hypothetical protein
VFPNPRSLLTLARDGRRQVVKPQDTRQVYYPIGTDTVRGRTFGDCWMFPCIEGRITGFSSYLPASEPQFIREGNKGRLRRFNPENVEALVADNEKALALALKGKLRAAILKYNEW